MKPLDHFLQVDHMFFIVIYMFLKFEPESGSKLTNRTYKLNSDLTNS